MWHIYLLWVAVRRCSGQKLEDYLQKGLSTADDLARLSPKRQEILRTFYSEWAESVKLMAEYAKLKAEQPWKTGTTLLQKAAKKLSRVDRAMLKAYGSGDGRLQFKSGSEAYIYCRVLSNSQKAFEDLFAYELEAAYTQRSIEFGCCDSGDEDVATCNAHSFNRLIILYRHHLGMPQNATFWFETAVAKTVNGKSLHRWSNEWQLGIQHWPGLKSQPYWEGPDEPLIASFLEEHHSVIKTEFLQALGGDTSYSEGWPQDNYYLTSKGDWSKLDIFSGGKWGQACKVMPKTCQLLSSREEIVGRPKMFASEPEPRPNGACIFRLTPGTHLKPHTGPANYRLLCHLGLLVPIGPWLKVGAGPSRAWHDGKASCFDDTYVHEVGHNGTQDRFVLMVSFWHPQLALTGKKRKHGKTSSEL